MTKLVRGRGSAVANDQALWFHDGHSGGLEGAIIGLDQSAAWEAKPFVRPERYPEV
jgi:hypothetical protein